MSTAKKRESFFNKERISRIPAAVLLSVIFSLLVFVVAPFEIYCNNLAEFKFSVGDFIWILLLFALSVTVFISAVLVLVPRCVYEYAHPAFIGILLMLFIQTNFLNGSLSSLAGDDMGDKTSVGTYIFNTLVWVLVIALIIVLSKLKRTKGITATVTLILTIAIGSAQVANFSLAAISTEGAFNSAIDRVYGEYSTNPRFLTNKGIEELGSERNVIVFCVDRFDTDLYLEPAMERFPETFAKLDGFTLYNDAISLYANTFPAVGYMMSGIEYDHGNHRDYFNKVYNQNSTISALHNSGYNVKLYSEAYYDYYNANELPDYVDNAVESSKESLTVEVRKPFKFGLALTKMSLFRSLPFVLKNTVGKMNSDTCNEYILYHGSDFGEYESYSYENHRAYKQIKEKVGSFATNGEKNFTFIHVSGCHTADYGIDWEKNHGIASTSDYVVSAKLSIDIVNMYIENMKAISPKLYHDSTIIILGDHGRVKMRTAMFDESMLTALFVKPSGKSGGPLKISDAPVSHENLWATIFQSEGIDYDRAEFGDSVFDIEKLPQNEKNEYVRKFLWNKRRVDFDSYDCVEYKIVGNARDFENWSVDKTTYYAHPLFAN